eukprot:gnl/Hemi2/564_TR196_c0_g11_i1.p1 gnl/Hemi2/564_TR196_c0_g11~~gnl/Hemi2/564_TR196_c0_g11_i1.p1  ORF type:complete len:324 (-),score=84.13 gnl/Hemi2/564_TR196_c0_g11_i1:43-969(-)
MSVDTAQLSVRLAEALTLTSSHEITPGSEQIRVSFPVSPSADPPPPITVEVLKEGQAWVLRNVFSVEECAAVIEQCEALGFQPLETYRADYRSNQRITARNELLTDALWARVRPFVPPVVSVAAGDNKLGFGLEGEWDVAGLNNQLRLCRYLPGGFFCPHRDGHFMPSPQVRSYFTCMLYLNGGFEGGSTNFLDTDKVPLFEGKPALAPPEAVWARVAPEPGLVLLFWHPLLHEGDALVAGKKYMMRTEVMYVRRDATAPAMDAKTQEAMLLMEKAEIAESNGKCEEAAQLYRQAFKLCPKLADAFGS